MANLDNNWKFRLIATRNFIKNFVQEERLRARRKDVLSKTGNFDRKFVQEATQITPGTPTAQSSALQQLSAATVEPTREVGQPIFIGALRPAGMVQACSD